MTLQTDVRIDGGYHNIPAFSSKSAGIIITPRRGSFHLGKRSKSGGIISNE